jgi:hypothetical protein
MKLKNLSKSGKLSVHAALASLGIAAPLQAAVLIEVNDTIPNGSRQLTTNYGLIMAPPIVPIMTYTLYNLDLESVGGTASDSIEFTVTLSQTGGTAVQFNTFGNISVTGGDNNHIDPAESLTATASISSTTFSGGLSNLFIAFTGMKIGGYSSGDVVDMIHSTGSITKNYSSSTTSDVVAPTPTSYFTMDVTAGKANLQGYSIQITAVPEPSTTLLCGLGVLGLLRRRR